MNGRRVSRRPFVPVLLGLLLLAPAGAAAQGELSARWGACGASGTGNSDPSPVCQGDFGERRLVLSIVPPSEIAQVVGWTLVLDLASDAATLPPWWQVQPGGCRSTVPGQFVAVTPAGGEDCLDPWSATGSALVQSLLYPRPGGDARQLRVILGVGVSAPDAFTLEAGGQYLAGILAIRFAGTTSGDCPGCAAPVCFVLNSAEIRRVPGAPGGDPPPLVDGGPTNGNQATWAGGIGCASVPARARTWGQIKNLYR